MKFTQFSLRSLCLLLVLAAVVMQYARPFRETRLAEKLKAPCQPQWTDKPLSQALAELAEQHHIRIQIDPRGLLEEGVANEVPTSIHLAKPIRLKTALAILLEPLNLDFEIRSDPWQGQYLWISSTVLFNQLVTTESIDVADLTSRLEEFPAGCSRYQIALLQQDLEQALLEHVSPPSWERYGGQGRLVWSVPGRTLQVTQTRGRMFDVHDIVGQLRDMRADVAARAYLAQLLCSGHTPGVWKVYRLETVPDDRSDPRLKPIAREVTASPELADRLDSILHDPSQMWVVDDIWMSHYGEPLECFRLCGETTDARFDVLLHHRTPNGCGVRIHLSDSRVVRLGLTLEAIAELRRICEQAFGGKGRAGRLGRLLANSRHSPTASSPRSRGVQNMGAWR